MPAVVSSSLVREWAQRALSGLGDARAEIDALNVFPVPDGDTGTNLYLTMESACEAVDQCWTDAADAPGVDEAARAMSTGALMGARGNSGVILSQILRGTSEILGGLTDGDALDGSAVHRLLARAADLGYEAVARPVEGTILTVARAAADSAAHPRPGGRRRCRCRRGGRGAGCPRRSRAHAHHARVTAPGRSRRRGGPRTRRRARRAGRGRHRRAAHGRRGRAPRPGAAARRGRGPPTTTAGRRTRSCSCSRPTTTPCPRCVPSSTPSATAWWSSAATGCGTSTCMSTMPGRRSRRRWRPVGRTACASRTSRPSCRRPAWSTTAPLSPSRTARE